MTEQEKQEIINAVLAALRTNSKTIAQLTPVTELSDDDSFEVSGGRRISYAAFLSAVQVGVQLMLDGYLTGEAAVAWFAALENNPANYVDAPNNPVQLHWRQSPIVLLDSMGEDLDGDSSFSPQVGDKWWDPTNSTTKNYIFLKTNTGQDGWPIGSGNVNDVLYVNKRTGRRYLWDGTDMVELVGTTGGGGMLVERTEDEYHVKYNFVDNSPALAVSVNSLVMGGNTKTAKFNVSGQRLKGNINISVSGSNFSLSQTQLTPTDGEVASTQITLTYSGTATATATITISSTGATSKTISAQYTEQQVPTIDISTDTITFKAGVGGTQTKTLLVKGFNLEGAIALAFTNNVGGRFTLSQNSFNPSGGSVNAQVTITYTPQSGDTGTFSATLRATSTNASNVDVPLSGVVSTIDVSKDSIELTTEANTPVTKTFTIEGANLNGDVTIGVSGTGFSVSPLSITKNDAEVSGGVSVVVTYSPTQVGTNSGQITIQSSGITKYVTLSGTAEEATAFDDETGHFNKNGIYYGAISDGNGGWTNNCKVYNPAYSASGSTYTGTINVPAQVVAGGRTFNVTHIATGAFNGCKTLNALTLPEGLTTIEVNAMYGWTNMSTATQQSVWSVMSLTIPSTVTTIGANFLYNCYNLGFNGVVNGVQYNGKFEWADPSNVNFQTTLGANWFGYCKEMLEVVIPDSITTLKTENSGATSAFTGCAKLAKVTFGANCASPSNFLQNASAIRTIIIKNTTSVMGAGWELHANIVSYANVYVPDSLYDDYVSHATWCQFYNEDTSLNRLHKLSDLSNS